MGFRHNLLARDLLARGALGLGSGAVFGLLWLAAGPAAAQHYNVIGQPGPSVTVDTSVLDELGPPNNIGAASRNVNRFGPGVAVRTAPPPRGTAAPPQSRLIAVPALPGRPTPQIGRGAAVNAAAPSSDASPASPPPVRQTQQASAPAAPVVPVMPPTPPAPPPQRQAAPPPPPPAVAPPPPPPTPVASAPPVPTAPAPPQPVSAPPPPAPPAAPPAAPAAAPAPAPQVAALPPAASAPSASASAGPGRLGFDSGSAALSDASRQELDRLATGLAGNEAQRLQVVAYAASQGGNTSAARRLSLSRALAVRSYLIDKGIRSTRIDVRAMGAPEGANSGPADRVDLVLVSQ
ncbi:MAG: OmpA family protein [Reyranellaceae bacterium]